MTAKQPVGAPIFYRDVPLIPSVGENGVISPLPKSAIGLIKWRLRNVGDTSSRILMEGQPTCANCHSFSRDGKTMGIDVDGPQNDKGLYTMVKLAKTTTIRNEDVIKWSAYTPIQNSVNIRVTFMPQVSPDGRYVVTTINDPGAQQTGPGLRPQERVFVANFKDYRFGQVFFPTRGVLAIYDSETHDFHTLPGANDPRLVQAAAFWSPDGKDIVFSRALAQEPFPPGSQPPQYANDPKETQIQYDLYRIPFNGGKGGVAVPIAGASQNGKSNNFPKISPDGRWIVFVQCVNGLLMRPDSQLYIVPFEGGTARLMHCNTSLMNSWHSFSPNGRWLVFSSKARSAYTQMYLTHLDSDGNDSPPILIEDSTAANRAVNIPEFVNLAPDGLEKIDTPAVEFYRVFDRAMNLANKEKYGDAIPEWRTAVQLNPDDVRPHFQLGFALNQLGHADEAITEYQQSAKLEPRSAPAFINLGVAWQRKGNAAEAAEAYRKALAVDPRNAKAQTNLGLILLEAGNTEEGVAHCTAALEVDPNYADAHNALGIVLARQGTLEPAIEHLDAAVANDPNSVPYQFNLGRVLAAAHRFEEAIPHVKSAAELTAGKEPDILAFLAALNGEMHRYREALEAARAALVAAQQQRDTRLVDELSGMIRDFEAQNPR